MDLETSLDYTKDYPYTNAFVNMNDSKNVFLKKNSIKYCDGHRRNVELFTNADSALVCFD